MVILLLTQQRPRAADSPAYQSLLICCVPDSHLPRLHTVTHAWTPAAASVCSYSLASLLGPTMYTTTQVVVLKAKPTRNPPNTPKGSPCLQGGA